MRTTLALALMGAALISMPAVAQNSAGQNSATQNSTAQNSATRNSGVPGQSGATQEAKAPPLYQIKPGEWRASKLDGVDVYNTNNEKIGDISDLIVDRSGKIQAVVIGIGGFLGIGEHLVAVPFEQVQWMDQPVERRTSSNDRGSAGNGTGTSGSGTSTESASGSAASGARAGLDRDAGTTAATAPPPGPAQVNAPLAGGAPGTPPGGDSAAMNTPAGGPAATNGPAGSATTVAPAQTRVDPSTGAMITTTGSGNATATGTEPSGTMGSERSAATGSTATGSTATGGDRGNTSDRTANRDNNNRNDTTRMYRPDHAVVAMTKDQLKALPEVRYAR